MRTAGTTAGSWDSVRLSDQITCMRSLPASHGCLLGSIVMSISLLDNEGFCRCHSLRCRSWLSAVLSLSKREEIPVAYRGAQVSGAGGGQGPGQTAQDEPEQSAQGGQRPAAVTCRGPDQGKSRCC